MTGDSGESLRRRMVAEQIAAKGVRDERVLDAFRRVPRHLFVPGGLSSRAYGDHPLDIGCQQTISQPYMVALMTEALGLQGGERVLEIGTGSGYQTAILLELGARVYTMERVAELAETARNNLERAGLSGAQFRVGDGTLGWPEEAPFDRAIVTAGAPSVPGSLVEQIRDGGSLVIPVGEEKRQELLMVRREAGRVSRRKLCECVFVKLLGREGW